MRSVSTFLSSTFWETYRSVYLRDMDYIVSVVTEEELEYMKEGLISRGSVFAVIQDALTIYEHEVGTSLDDLYLALDGMYDICEESDSLGELVEMPMMELELSGGAKQ